jgi:2'-5' RNA ligase
VGLAAPRPAVALKGRRRAGLPLGLGAPSARSAVIVRTSLPAGLERLRRREITDASEGVPAHLTLLYPFVEPHQLDDAVRAAIAQAVATIEPFDYDLARAALFPDTVYAAVDPVEPFIDLQAALERAFPAFPVYGPDRPFEYVPHVSIAEGEAARHAAWAADSAWRALPLRRRADRVDIIAKGDDGFWRTRWRIPLGRPARSGRR